MSIKCVWRKIGHIKTPSKNRKKQPNREKQQRILCLWWVEIGGRLQCDQNGDYTNERALSKILATCPTKSVFRFQSLKHWAPVDNFRFWLRVNWKYKRKIFCWTQLFHATLSSKYPNLAEIRTRAKARAATEYSAEDNGRGRWVSE